MTTVVIRPGMQLPAPDEPYPDRFDARLGDLRRAVAFAAAVQATDIPRAWRIPHVMVFEGDHDGGASAGGARAHDALEAVAARARATVRVVPVIRSRAVERGPALHVDEVDRALRDGWRLAEEAVTAGADVIVIGARGAGTETAAAALLALATGADVTGLLPRVVTGTGYVDDAAWMTRCIAARDAIFRVRPRRSSTREVPADHSFSRLAQVNRPRRPLDAHALLRELGGAPIATATGLLLGAAACRTPVLLDGPVGAAAAVVSRDLFDRAPRWCLLPERGRNPAVVHAAGVLGLTPVTDLGLDLGEGATALAVLPLLTAAMALCSSVPDPAGSSMPDPAGFSRSGRSGG